MFTMTVTMMVLAPSTSTRLPGAPQCEHVPVLTAPKSPSLLTGSVACLEMVNENDLNATDRDDYQDRGSRHDSGRGARARVHTGRVARRRVRVASRHLDSGGRGREQKVLVGGDRRDVACLDRGPAAAAPTSIDVPQTVLSGFRGPRWRCGRRPRLLAAAFPEGQIRNVGCSSCEMGSGSRAAEEVAERPCCRGCQQTAGTFSQSTAQVR